jgi:hypothetical protein
MELAGQLAPLQSFRQLNCLTQQDNLLSVGRCRAGALSGAHKVGERFLVVTGAGVVAC